MEGVISFIYGSTNVGIYGCPRDIQIYLGNDQGTVKIIDCGVTTSFYSNKHNNSLYYHVRGHGIDNDTCDLFNKCIGFIPFYEHRDGKRWYVPKATFKTREEMEARKKPVQTQMFLKVLNLAFIREMATVCELMDAVPDITGFPEEIEIGKLDPNVAVHFTDALIALLPEHRSIKKMQLEHLVIYDFLGLTRLDQNKMYFINGDRIMECTQPNLAIAGQLWQCKRISLFPTFEEFGDPHKIVNCKYLSDNMIAEYKLWKTVLRIGDSPELSPIQVRVMQYLIHRNSH
jgi:hypothetical protein